MNPPSRMPAFTEDWLGQYRVSGLPCSAGRYTYGRPDVQWRPADQGRYGLRIGAFCSIGKNCSILVGEFGRHEAQLLSTYPISMVLGALPPRPIPKVDLSVQIGNDVWIGQNVTILAGIEIGDGAIIGASSLVNRSVPPYSICAGVPARPIRYRFPLEIVDRLLKVRWWDLPDDVLKRELDCFVSDDIEAVLTRLEGARQQADF